MDLVALAMLGSAIRSHWYCEVIDNDEVGLAIAAGQIRDIEQPGVADDFDLFVDLAKVKTSAVALTSEFNLQ